MSQKTTPPPVPAKVPPAQKRTLPDAKKLLKEWLLSGGEHRLQLKDLFNEAKGSEKTAGRVFQALKKGDAETEAKAEPWIRALSRLFEAQAREYGRPIPRDLTMEHFWSGPSVWRKTLVNRSAFAGEEFDEGESSAEILPPHVISFIDELRNRLSEARAMQNDGAVIQLSESLATIFETSHMWTRAAERLKILIYYRKKHQDWVLCARALARLAVAYYRRDRFKEARASVLEAALILRRNAPRGCALRTEAKLNDYRGLVALRMRKPAVALRIFEKRCLPMRTSLKTPLGLASVYVRMGLANIDLGRYEEADCGRLGATVEIECESRSSTGAPRAWLALLSQEPGRSTRRRPKPSAGAMAFPALPRVATGRP